MNSGAGDLDLSGYLTWCRTQVDAIIDQSLRTQNDSQGRLIEAMRYAILGGGKRLRPALVLLACEASGKSPEIALPAAAAIEMIHTYSLIHDDLPCMDDDDYRRGRLTVHKKFDEATAVLTGDALHALAFEILAHKGNPTVVREVAHFIGTAGILGGQMDDLLAEGTKADEAHVTSIHLRKTASLITASLRVGGHLGEASAECLEMLSAYGRNIGLAFQIVDDILDEVGSTEQLGKPAGSDRQQQKATYPDAVGLNKSRERAAELVESAKRAIAGIPQRYELFIALADYIISRDR
ncbi:polyprenyl synthetase family protein [Candidatus Zixiibacteriota bacterium]